ncbi:MAG: hypothetical protein J7M40_00765 [Planctomycetes bacterium]|nr:hypothetical protein [Planctomycetota bacterium]
MNTMKKTIITLLAVLAVSTALAGENLPKPDPEFHGNIGETFQDSKPDAGSFRRRSAYDYYAKLDDGLVQRALPPSLFAAESESGSKGTLGSEHNKSRSLLEKATDPTSILTQLQFQNIFVPNTYDADGYSNQTILQPVLPIPTGWDLFPMQILRPTLPLHVHSADPDGPVEETSGLGDLLVIDLFLPKRAEWGTWGIGPVAIFPTASDDRLGQGKWQLGPAAVVLYSGIKNWQFGGLVQNPISIAGDSDRNAVSTLLVQPIATRHFKDGWYAGWGEIPFSYEWLNGDYNIPLNMRLGRVTKLGNAPVNMFIEPFYTPSSFQREGQSEWGIKFNLTFLFPKK